MFFFQPTAVKIASTSAGPLPPVTAEEGGPHKLSTKRRSADTADKLFMNSIEDEVMQCCLVKFYFFCDFAVL